MWRHFKTHLLDRGYPENVIQEALSEVHFKDRTLDLNKNKKNAENFAFCNNINQQYQTENNVSRIADI